MKAILEFNLPEEGSEHRHALDGAAWASILHAVDEELRAKEKYGGQASMPTSEVRAMIREAMEHEGLRFE